MVDRTHRSVTRRHFLETAAAASASGAFLIGHSGVARAMAFAPIPDAIAHAAVKLANGKLTMLGSMQLPSIGIADAGSTSFSLGEFRASYSVTGGGDLLNWLMSLPRKTHVAKAGSVFLTDYNFAVKQRCDWTQGRVTSLELPTLGTGEKAAFKIKVRWAAHTADLDVPIDTPKLSVLPVKALAWSPRFFRVVGLPGDAHFIRAVQLPTVKAKLSGGGAPDIAGVELGDLTITVSARDRAAQYKEVRKIVDDGKLSAGEHRDLTIEMLSSTADVLGKISLKGCGLVGYEDAEFASTIESHPTFKLRFRVTSLDLKPA